MTLQSLFESITGDSLLLIYYFVIMPIIALLIGFISGKESNQEPWKYIFSVLVYLVCIPGIFSFILCLYSFFFESENLLQVNVLVYFLPIVSMIGTLIIIANKIPLVEIPGFHKISGLLMVIAATFVLILLLQKTRIWVVFVGSIWHLIAVIGVLFLLIKFGFDKVMKTRKPANQN